MEQEKKKNLKLMIIIVIVVVAIIGIIAVVITSNNNSNDKTTTNQKATIIDNEGNEIEMSAEDLMNIFDTNEARFFKLYGGAKITFYGTVEQIGINTSVMAQSGKITTGQQKIVFKEGWGLTIGTENRKFDLASYNAGDVLKVTTSIVTAKFDTEPIKNLTNNKRVVWLVGNDEMYFGETFSNIETTIERVNGEKM